jgi:hypothetical protein
MCAWLGKDESMALINSHSLELIVVPALSLKSPARYEQHSMLAADVFTVAASSNA